MNTLPITDAADLHDLLAGGATVVTANKRLARSLRQTYEQRCLDAGAAVWATPSIVSYMAWLTRQLCELGQDHRLLTEAQALYLWEEAVAADAASTGRDLLQVAQAARQASKARQLLSAYLADVPFHPREAEHQAFLRWRQRFLAECRRHDAIEHADLLPLVTSAVVAGRLPVPATMVFAGFDDFVPALTALIEALAERGCSVSFYQPQAVALPAVSVAPAADRAEEVRLCARWARAQLASDPALRVGVVVPELSRYQALIEQIFRAELVPAACASLDDEVGSFTLSLGTPLADEGVVRAALRLLAVGGGTLPFADLSWLLRSPYLGGAAAEWPKRVTAERRLREDGRSEWSLAAAIRVLRPLAPRLAASFEVLQAGQRERGRRLPGGWAQVFADLLSACGWPGDRGLSSREYQAVDHLRALLGQLAALDRLARPQPASAALGILRRLAAQAVFQPEGGESRLQVMGVLEAGGAVFDALWIMGMYEGALPAAASPHPLLPLDLQSRLRMPHADAGREHDFAGRLARRLFTAAPLTIASWPAAIDGAGQRPSPLLQGFPAANLDLPASQDPFIAMSAAPCGFELLADARGPTVPAGRPFAGGSALLKDQALCPFRAFARHRLRAEPLAATTIGLDGMSRGTLVHTLLELFWAETQSRIALCQLSAEALASQLDECAERSLAHFERRSRRDLPGRLRAIEKRRLVTVAGRWLEIERERGDFFVKEIEKRHIATVGRLQLRTRIDRIDELPSGKLAVIDYKSGRTAMQQWLEERITEPQLPLYCLAHDGRDLAAVLFAEVRGKGDECAFRGVAREPDEWPKMKGSAQEKLFAEYGWRDFDALIAHWQSALTALGNAFADGVAIVDPVDPARACSACDLGALCRFSGALADPDENQNGGEESHG